MSELYQRTQACSCDSSPLKLPHLPTGHSDIHHHSDMMTPIVPGEEGGNCQGANQKYSQTAVKSGP